MKSKLPTPSLDCENAWLSPSGDCYPNPGFAWHSRQAEAICEAFGFTDTGEGCRAALIKRGWAYLRDGEGWEIPSANDSECHQWERLTERQLDTIFDWHIRHNKPLPSYLAPAEVAPESELAVA